MGQLIFLRGDYSRLKDIPDKSIAATFLGPLNLTSTTLHEISRVEKEGALTTTYKNVVTPWDAENVAKDIERWTGSEDYILNLFDNIVPLLARLYNRNCIVVRDSIEELNSTLSLMRSMGREKPIEIFIQ